MATRFLKLDLAKNSRDYEPIALRMGIALLDREGANYRALNKHFGRLLAEPEWQGDEVAFFVSDKLDARLHNIQCEPVSARDLTGVKTLYQDFESLKTGFLDLKADPDNRDLFTVLHRHFEQTTVSAKGQPIGNHCFRYRDQDGNWRLVWCWGYQRRDQEPADPAICANPDCRQLIARRKRGDRDCPACNAQATPASSKRLRLPLIVVPLILLLAAGLGLLAIRWNNGDAKPSIHPVSKLTVEPANWTIPPGGKRKYQVFRISESGERRDITFEAVAVSEDPGVARFDPGTATLHARSRGKTALCFFLGDEKVYASVNVEPARNPQSIQIEPSKLTLGVGATADFVLRANFGDGQNADLTQMAEWSVGDDAHVSCATGKIEGISPGETTIGARYRATPEDSYLAVDAAVNVVEEEYVELEIKVEPATLRKGTAAELEVVLITKSGERRSAVNSSLLELTLNDSSMASIIGQHLHAIHKGQGTVTAIFGGLTASAEFTVEPDMTERFVVSPKDLQMFVGEVAELDVVSGSSEAIQVDSSDPKVVAVASGSKVIGRSAGKAVLTVIQSTHEASIEVEVKRPKLKSLAFVPMRMSVPLDHRLPIRLVANTSDDQQFDLAPDAVIWEKLPRASVVEIDVAAMELLGRQPTNGESQQMVVRSGGIRASGEVDVISVPLRMALTPEGPLDLSLGQTTQLHAWVRYGNGTRVEVDPQRIQWRISPPDTADLFFDPSTGGVRAVKSGGSLSVVGDYQGYTSNTVVCKSRSAKFTLQLHADRAMFIVGDQGRFRITVDGTTPEVALVGYRLESQIPSILSIDRDTGAYRALAPGAVRVVVQHPHASNTVVERIEVLARENAGLVIRPERVKLLVGSRQEVHVVIVSGNLEDFVSLLSGRQHTRVSIARPNSVDWLPPVLTGLEPAAPFEMTVEHEGMTARAVVEVLEAGEEIRVKPDRARLSAGQAISPIVEQRIPNTDLWQEIEPLRITWEVPDGVRWTPATQSLRPQLTPTAALQSASKLTATYCGKTGSMDLEFTSDAPPRGELTVEREPSGESLPVGSEQRYAIVVRQGDKQFPAADVEWPSAFENDHVRWDPPILTAKRAGHEQVLTAAVNDERVSFATRTIAPIVAASETPPPSDTPSAIRIVTDRTPPIMLAVGSRFDSYRIEADYADRPPYDVTRQAEVRVSDSTIIDIERGHVIGRKSGSASLAASYHGVIANKSVDFRVVDDVPITDLVVTPQSYQMKVGETVKLRVKGFVSDGKERSSIGDIEWLPKLQFQSDAPDVLRADGPTLTGLAEGQANVAITIDDVSRTVAVEVISADGLVELPLVVSPQSLRLSVGQSKLLGRDFVVQRGNVDLSEQVEVESSDPDTVDFHPADRSIEGIAAGSATLAIHFGGQMVSLPILIEGDGRPNEGIVVVEPDSRTLAVGEFADLRVYLVGDDGKRIDRTASASLVSSDESVGSVRRNRITGVSAGAITIKAKLPGIAESGSADFQVVSENFTSLNVIPSILSLAVGERKTLQIQAVGPVGRRSLGNHPDLEFRVSGAKPNSVELNTPGNIRGVVPGEASLTISWKDLKADPVSIQVTEPLITGLRINPPSATLEANGRQRFQVFATRGERETLISSDDGLTFSVDDPSVASVEEDSVVRGRRVGTTSLVARLGAHRASAQLTVVPDSGRDRLAAAPTGLRFIPDVLRLQLGAPGGTVRLVKESVDGTVENLNQHADFEITPQAGNDVVSVKWTALGALLTAQATGEADVHARSGKWTTRRPLRVLVVDPLQANDNREPAHLRVQPDPLELRVGESGAFQRVQLIPNGGSPVDVAYKIEAMDDDKVISVEGNQVRGAAVGQSGVTVRPVGVDMPFSDVKSMIMVNVRSGPSPASRETRLVLRGPSQGTVGGPLEFRVTRENDGEQRDVTFDGASLVLTAEQASAVSLESGCRIVPQRTGTLTLKARYRDLISNALTVTIDSTAADVARIELEIERRPMLVGERRNYSIWGYPFGDGAPQELTHRVGAASAPMAMVRVSPKQKGDVKIVSHDSTSIVGNSSGTVLLQAEFSRIQSEVVEIEIVEADEGDLSLATRPSSATIRVGERTPTIEILASSPGGKPTPVDAQWSSEDPSIASPDPDTPGRFIGERVGQTRLKATYHGTETAIALRVTGDPFRSVSIHEKPVFQAGNRFLVTIRVEASMSPDESLEYRVTSVDKLDSGDWLPSPSGENQRIELGSPPLQRGSDDTTYHLMVEARGEQGRIVARYPLSFSLNQTIQSHSAVEEKP